MKPAILISLIISFAASAFAAEDPHAKKQAGPTGGRLITSLEPHAEFFVNPDRKVEIRFVDEANKVVPPAGQAVSVIMGDRSAPTKMTFALSGDKLLSDVTVPEGNEFPTVLQIQPTPGAKTVISKFNLNLSQCPDCSYAEYACVCEHAE